MAKAGVSISDVRISVQADSMMKTKNLFFETRASYAEIHETLSYLWGPLEIQTSRDFSFVSHWVQEVNSRTC